MNRVYVFAERFDLSQFLINQDIRHPAIEYFKANNIPIKHIEYDIPTLVKHQSITLVGVSLSREDAAWIILSQGFELVETFHVFTYTTLVSCYHIVSFYERIKLKLSLFRLKRWITRR